MGTWAFHFANRQQRGRSCDLDALRLLLGGLFIASLAGGVFYCVFGWRNFLLRLCLEEFGDADIKLCGKWSLAVGVQLTWIERIGWAGDNGIS
jgi:hypothetical protein